MSDDLISRSALKKAMWDESYSIATFTECGAEISRLGLTITEIEHIIDNALTVCNDNYSMGYQDGVRKVLSERPQGEWIDHSGDEGYLECPICGCLTNCCGNKEELHYCWNCGAKLMCKGADNE